MEWITCRRANDSRPFPFPSFLSFLSIFDGPFPSTILFFFTLGGFFFTGVLFRWRWCVNVLRHQFQFVLDVLEFREKDNLTQIHNYDTSPKKATKMLIWKRNKSWSYIKFNCQINKQQCYCCVTQSQRVIKELMDYLFSTSQQHGNETSLYRFFYFERSVHYQSRPTNGQASATVQTSTIEY